VKKLFLHDFKKDYSLLVSECITCLAEEAGVILLPTDTVYGLVCDWENQAARDKIYRLKQRDRDKPLQMLIPELSYLGNRGITPFPALKKVVSSFCPGPLTIVVSVPGQNQKIGFRIPEHELVLKLLRTYKRPLAATSANLSGEAPLLSADEALAKFAEAPDLVIDGGRLPEGARASTVVELSPNGHFTVLRPGPISARQLADALE
jgi:tRNA threonylcarbamoyl adenosine modification protein (Sua5/YciO/YrdC/YwlC family)